MLKMMLLISVVQSAGISGLTAFVPGRVDHAEIYKSMAKKLRATSLGQASVVTQEGVRTVNNWALFMEWGFCPAALELTVQRLKWWVDVARHVKQNKFLLTVMFGELRIAERRRADGLRAAPRTLHPKGHEREGQIAEDAHPWARQLARDLEILKYCPGAERWAQLWSGKVCYLYLEGEVHREFVGINPHGLKAACCANSLPHAVEDILQTLLPQQADRGRGGSRAARTVLDLRH